MEQRKQRIAAQAELNATLAADRMTNELQSDKHIPLNALVPVFGVNVDKALALRGDTFQTVCHLHSFDLSDEDLIAFAVAQSKKPKAIEAEILTDRQDGQERLKTR